MLQYACRMFSRFSLFMSGTSARGEPCLESDLFSLGCCLYMLACGLYPFDTAKSCNPKLDAGKRQELMKDAIEMCFFPPCVLHIDTYPYCCCLSQIQRSQRTGQRSLLQQLQHIQMFFQRIPRFYPHDPAFWTRQACSSQPTEHGCSGCETLSQIPALVWICWSDCWDYRKFDPQSNSNDTAAGEGGCCLYLWNVLTGHSCARAYMQFAGWNCVRSGSGPGKRSQFFCNSILSSCASKSFTRSSNQPPAEAPQLSICFPS